MTLSGKGATFFATMIDFAEPGELEVFVDEKQVSNLEKKMRERGYGVTVHLDVKRDAYADDAPSRDVHIDPDWHPTLLTTAGAIPATTTRIIAHEFGHAVMGTRDDGPNRMNNVIENENPIMRELYEPERTQY